uniref:Ig-like domain-containing protein n=1 Tax=Sus scrofa TaxID=9823 RepID=A0A4X1W1Q6_PIG
MVRERHSWDLNLTLRLSPGLLGRASSCPADHHTCPNSSAGRGQHHPGCSGLGRGRAPVLQLVRGAGTEMAQQILTFHVISGGLTLGPAHTGQETVKPDGSLHIAGLNLADMGPYTLRKILMDMSHPTWSVYLPVYEYMPQPSILADNIAPMEDMDSVTLTCVPPKSVAAIRWFKDSDVLSTGGRGELSPDHRFLTLQNITRNDTGLYQCEASNSATSSLSNPLPVNMNYGPGVPVINPMDSTFVAGSNLTLSCFASSNPPAAYTWRVDGSPGPAGQLLSILDVSLNSSGLYSCHAANADTGLQSMAQLVVHIKDQGSCVFSPEKIQTIQHGVMIQKAGYYLAIHHLTSYPVKEEKTHKLHVQRRSNWDVNSETAGCHGTHGSLEI